MFIRRENFKQFIKFYPVVSIIIAINLFFYILTLSPAMKTTLFNNGASFNLLIENGEWWRVITSIFLHDGFLHVLFNMFSLI